MKCRIINKLMMSFLVFISLMCVSVEIFSSTLMTIPNPDGGIIYHYGTSNPVQINSEYVLKDTEFRAVWVSPLVNDIGTFSSEDQYKKMMINVLENMEAYKLNVLLFHIRIMNDAFYKSDYSDYSIYYSTNPTWEALPWLIEECHRRGIEFHAWMNPYRVTNSVSRSLTDVSKEFRSINAASNPDNLLKGKNSIILNPGEPAVKDFLINVCMEVVNKFNVDAIHFDDYFYDDGIDDTVTREKYNTNKLSIGDFRRAQVDEFIYRLSSRLREYNLNNNKRVQLGISPSGIWKAGNGVVNYDANGNAISSGSSNSSASFQHYDNYLYSDTLKWINEEWIDYIIPQTYWAINHPACPYADLMAWWDKVVKYKEVKVYSGLGIYLSDSSSGYGWYTNKEEVYYQLMISNNLDNVNGVCFFRYGHIEKAVKNPDFTKKVSTIWTTPTIQPEITTMPTIDISKVNDLNLYKTENGYQISFDRLDDAKFYVIYRSTSPLTYSSKEVIKVVGDLSHDGVVSYVDTAAVDGVKYYYGIRAQSISNTLGEGVSKDTEGVASSDGVYLGDIEELSLSDSLIIGERVSVIFKELSYPYGGKMSYSLTYKFDTGTSRTITTFNQKGGYLAYELKVPEDATLLDIELVIKNSFGQTTRSEVFSVTESAKGPKNFGFIGDVYAGREVTYLFTNAYVTDGTYSLMYTTDNLKWNELDSFSSNEMSLVISRTVTLPNFTGNISYRIALSKNDIVGYSNVVSKEVYSYLGDFKNIKINGFDPVSTYVMNQGDILKIEFDITTLLSQYSYNITYSTNKVNWISINTYSSTSFVNIVNNKATINIPIANSHIKLYIRINGISTTYRSFSEEYEIYVSLKSPFADTTADFIGSDINTNIKELGIF